MADDGPGAQARIDELYRLPLEEFTSARNLLAQQLRRAGERELSEQVKGLRKPSVAAWALNQLRHRQPARVDALLNAGLRLREAQERLLGRGERGLLRDAAAEERRLVDETVQAAEAQLRDHGQAVSAALHNKLWETAHAAALDPELGDTLRRGRLVEDRQLSDLGLIGGLGSLAAPDPGSASGPTTGGAPGAGTAPAGTAPAPGKPSPQRQRQREQARQRVEQREEKLADALQAADQAEAQLSEAQSKLRRAEADAARALSVAEQAQAALEQAREQLHEASERLDALEAED